MDISSLIGEPRDISPYEADAWDWLELPMRIPCPPIDEWPLDESEPQDEVDLPIKRWEISRMDEDRQVEVKISMPPRSARKLFQ